MEAFTCARVSPAARRAYLAQHPGHDADFTRCHGGYVMCGWESSIAMARAMGRGSRRGEGKPPHAYDLRRSRWEQTHPF